MKVYIFCSLVPKVPHDDKTSKYQALYLWYTCILGCIAASNQG